MIFEAICPLEIKTRTLGTVSLDIGDRVEWPDEAVKMLVQKYPGKARVVKEQPQIQAGVWVEFQSPLFGLVTAKFKSVEVENVWLTDHSVLRGENESCRIPVKWIKTILQGD